MAAPATLARPTGTVIQRSSRRRSGPSSPGHDHRAARAGRTPPDSGYPDEPARPPSRAVYPGPDVDAAWPGRQAGGGLARWHRRRPPAASGNRRAARPAAPAGTPPRPHPASWARRAAHWCRTYRLDLIWVLFVLLNLAAMRFLPEWQTVPFLAIWVSLTAIYGLRLWRLQPTILTVAAVTFATGGIVVVQVIKGQQDADYLAEVPLIALMFLVM